MKQQYPPKAQYPWSPKTFKRKLEHHGLTRLQVADLVRVTERTSYNWLSGSGPPYVVALVLELMERCNLTPADLEEIGTQLTRKRN